MDSDYSFSTFEELEEFARKRHWWFTINRKQSNGKMYNKGSQMVARITLRNGVYEVDCVPL